jgi:hypothetical protein
MSMSLKNEPAPEMKILRQKSTFVKYTPDVNNQPPQQCGGCTTKQCGIAGFVPLNTFKANVFFPRSSLPHGGLPTFHQKSTCLKKINFQDFGNANWSRYTLTSSPNETLVVHCVALRTSNRARKRRSTQKEEKRRG